MKIRTKEEERFHQEELRKERIKKNLCIVCAKFPPAYNVLRCVQCSLKKKQYDRKRYIEKIQKELYKS